MDATQSEGGAGGVLTLPIASLGVYPTPVERLREVERAAGFSTGTELWIKREDLAGAPWGTSKVRKLEHVFGEASNHGVAQVATVGPLGSHHALATAIYARTLGFSCRLQLWPEPLTPAVAINLRAVHALGARVELLGGGDERSLATLAGRGGATGQTWFVPPAGTDPIGATGYVECGQELCEQVDQGAMPVPDFIFVAGGTGGIAAGLAVGLRLASRGVVLRRCEKGLRVLREGARGSPGLMKSPLARRPIHAVRVVSRAVLSVARLRLLASRIGARLGVREDPGPDAFRLLHAHAGGGYGAMTREACVAARLFADEAGLVLDPIYTAKAAAGVLAFARTPEGAGRRHLFLHTYGVPRVAELIAGVAWEDVPICDELEALGLGRPPG